MPIPMTMFSLGKIAAILPVQLSSLMLLLSWTSTPALVSLANRMLINLNLEAEMLEQIE